MWMTKVRRLSGFIVVVVLMTITSVAFCEESSHFSKLLVSTAVTGDTFCLKAQQLIADTTIESDNQLHDKMDSFVKAKPKEFPLTTHQYVSKQLSDTVGAEFPVIVSCKMKTAERINQAVSGHGPNGTSPVDKAERSCRDVNQHTWQGVLAELPDIQRREDTIKIVFDEDENTFIGPKWLKPWPYQVAYTDVQGITHIRSKSLHVEYSIFIPMPKSFKGTHYCHLIAPEYLAALAAGRLKAPVLE